MTPGKWRNTALSALFEYLVQLLFPVVFLVEAELEGSLDFNGACVFYYNAKANELLGSALFANVAKLKDGAQITLKTNFGEIPTTFRIDKTLKGTIALFAHPSAQNYFEKLKLA